MHQSTQYLGSSLGFDIEDFAVNETAAGLAEGLAAAHRAYGVERYCIFSHFIVAGFIPLPGRGFSCFSQMNITCLIHDGSSTSCGNGHENYLPLCYVSNLECFSSRNRRTRFRLRLRGRRRRRITLISCDKYVAVEPNGKLIIVAKPEAHDSSNFKNGFIVQ